MTTKLLHSGTRHWMIEQSLFVAGTVAFMTLPLLALALDLIQL